VIAYLAEREEDGGGVLGCYSTIERTYYLRHCDPPAAVQTAGNASRKESHVLTREGKAHTESLLGSRGAAAAIASASRILAELPADLRPRPPREV
jgi:hypothetical protein